MSRKIYGRPVATPINPNALVPNDVVKTVNGIGPDENGNVVVEGGGGGNVDLTGYATEEYVKNKIAEAELGGEEVDLSGYAQKTELPTKVSQLENDKGYLTKHQDLSAYALKTELPSVPVQSVNGKTGAVNLSASDVGAMPNGTKIPSKTSDLTNDSGFITGYTETDPTVPAWAKATTKPSYSKSEVGLGNVDNVKQYSASNPPPYPVTSVNGKTGAVTLDASAVGARPSSWMPSASDVGALPASTTIPTKTSQLTNDSGFIKSYTETDPTVPSWAKASSKPSYSKSEVGLGNVDNVKQYSASNPPPYPVTSVNGKTGAVTVSVPTKVSQLQNDAGYLTEISKEEIVQQVITALGTPVFGRVDADNNIILTGNLQKANYTVKYENADGILIDIGTIGFAYINLADQSSADWLTGKRINSSGVIKDAPGWDMTNFIEISADTKKIYIKGLNITSNNSSGENYGRVYAYDGEKTYKDYKQPSALASYFYAADYDSTVTVFDVEAARSDSNMNAITGAAYLRFGGEVTSDNVIITINEEIN